MTLYTGWAKTRTTYTVLFIAYSLHRLNVLILPVVEQNWDKKWDKRGTTQNFKCSPFCTSLHFPFRIELMMGSMHHVYFGPPCAQFRFTY